MSYTTAALQDIHSRSHRSLQRLLQHCDTLPTGDLDRTLDGFGYPTIQRQLHHAIGAEAYWLSVLHGAPDASEDPDRYNTAGRLEAFRSEIHDATDTYIADAADPALNAAADLVIWTGDTMSLVPAHVILRTTTHIHHHIGQVLAMCRLRGHPASRMDFPLD